MDNFPLEESMVYLVGKIVCRFIKVFDTDGKIFSPAFFIISVCSSKFIF